MTALIVRNKELIISDKSSGWKTLLSPVFTKEIEGSYASIMGVHRYKLEYYKGEK